MSSDLPMNHVPPRTAKPQTGFCPGCGQLVTLATTGTIPLHGSMKKPCRMIGLRLGDEPEKTRIAPYDLRVRPRPKPEPSKSIYAKTDDEIEKILEDIRNASPLQTGG